MSNELTPEEKAEQELADLLNNTYPNFTVDRGNEAALDAENKFLRQELEELRNTAAGPRWVKGTHNFPVRKPVIAKKFISYLNKEVVGVASSATGEMICFDWGGSAVCLAIGHEELNDLYWLDEQPAAGREKENKNEFVEILDNALEAGEKVLNELRKQNAAKEDAVALIKYIRDNYKRRKDAWTDNYGIATLTDQGVYELFKQQKEK